MLRYDIVYALSRRARYKLIDSDINYCHFVFQGVRVESIKDETGNYIVCCCKGGSTKKTNKPDTYTDKIFYIADNNTEVVYDKNIYNNFILSFLDYVDAHKNWI
jgi:hypothetical protein